MVFLSRYCGVEILIETAVSRENFPLYARDKICRLLLYGSSVHNLARWGRKAEPGYFLCIDFFNKCPESFQ